MTVCPDCGHQNIPGEDVCESCGQSLTSLSKPKPSNTLGQHILKDRIDALPPREPVSVAPTTKVGDVLQLLVDKHIGCVLVVEDGRLVGIFSERDALFRLNTEAADLNDHPISQFMTESPSTLELNDKIAFAVHKMALGGYRHIPILTDGRPTGVISIRDVLRYTTEKLQAYS